MKLLKISFLLSIFIVNFSVCGAQNKKPKKTIEQKSIEMTKKLSKEVKLTPAQETKATSINTSYLKQKKVLDAKIKQIEIKKKKLKKQRKAEMNKILTTSQKEKLALIKKRKDRRKKK